MDKKQLKDLIQEIYDDCYFAEFNLHFVDCVEPHKVYEIKNNRIINNLKDTTVIACDSMISNPQLKDMQLWGIGAKDFFTRKMIGETANKILTDIYKINSFQRPPVIELTITNWQLYEERVEDGIAYRLRFEIA